MTTTVAIETVKRDILEAIKRYTDMHGHQQIPRVELIISQTPSLQHAMHPLAEVRWYFDQLKKEGFIKYRGETPNGFGMTLTSEGRQRLEVPEEDFQRGMKPASSSTHVTNHIGTVGQFAQTLGKNSPVTQKNHGLEFQQVAELIERLVSNVKGSTDVPDETKDHAESEAKQLEWELRKPHPSLERITAYYEWFKAFAVQYVKFAPLVHDLFKLALALVVKPKAS